MNLPYSLRCLAGATLTAGLVLGAGAAQAQKAGAEAETTAAADSVTVRGHVYERAIQVAGSRLRLNGTGTRVKIVVPVYTAGLWTSKPVRSLGDMLAASGPKRLKLTLLRRVSANELGNMFNKGVNANLSAGDANRVLIGLGKMGEIFANAKAVNPGDPIVMDWVPGKGTQVYIRNQLQGTIAEPEFYRALMGLWLGQNPVDWHLKEGLLQGEK